MSLSYEGFCRLIIPKLSKPNSYKSYADWYCNLCELYIRDWRSNINIVNSSYHIQTRLGQPYQQAWYKHYLKLIANPLAKPSIIFTHRPASL